MTTDDLDDRLGETGYDDPLQLAVANPQDVMDTLDVSKSKAEKLIESARTDADVGGFTTGTEVSDPPDLSEVDAVPDVEGWSIRHRTKDRISWVTPSDYAIAVTTQPSRNPEEESTFTVTGTLPPKGEHNPQQTKKERRTLKEGIQSGEEAVGHAVGIMELHPLDFEQDLTVFPGISERTAEYLLFKNGVQNHQGVYGCWRDGELQKIVTTNYHEELEEKINEMFGPLS